MATITSAGKISNTATSATSSNTANAIVLRDANGDFTANVITGTLSGTASNITASSNSTLNTLSALTSVGTLTSLNVSGATSLSSLTTSGTSTLTSLNVTGSSALNTLTANSAVVSGTVTATAFVGDGSGITGLGGSNIVDGSITSAKITDGTIVNADISSTAAIPFSKLNITKANITGLGVQEGLTAGSGISISAGTISATGLTSSNLASNAAITNAQLANSSTTLGSTTMTLGGTVTSVTGLTSVSSTGFTGALTGNASTATKLAATKNINGVAFDGSADITIVADANTLTGTTLASNVVNSSLTSVGAITSGVWSATTIAIAKGGTGATTKTAAFDALSPMTTSGDIIYGSNSGTATRLAKGTDGQVLTLASGIPSWSTLSAVTTLGTFTTTTTYANGGTISGSTLTLGAADGTNPGLVSTVAQTIAGSKTFSSDIITNEVRVGKGVAGNTSNTVLGKSALTATSTVTNQNILNTAIGISAMQNASGTGSYNTSVGANSGFWNSSGSDNTNLGYQSGYNTTSGSKNVAIGSKAMLGVDGSYLTGAGNNAIGFEAMKDISTTAADNIAIGLSAGTKLTTGTKNIFIGSLAGSSISTASSANTTGLNSVLIGYDVRPLANGETNEIVISGYNGTTGTVGQGSHSTSIGNSSTTRAVIYGSTSLSNLPTTATAGNGGDFTLEAQDGFTSGNTNGGNINLTPGSANGTGTAGVVKINGSIQITGGSPAAGKVLTSDASGGATWQNSGGSVVTMNSTGTATSTATYIIFTGTTASQTITIPSAVTMGSGREITIKNVASVSVSVASAGGYLIQDNSTLTSASAALGIEPSNNWMKLVSDGTNWYIFRALF